MAKKKKGKKDVKKRKALHILNLTNPVFIAGRNAYLLLLKINFRGHASRISRGTENQKENIFSRWYNLGGSVNSFKKALDVGKNKKPLMCGKKCKTKIGADGTLSFHDVNGFEMDNYYLPNLMADGSQTIDELYSACGCKMNADGSIEYKRYNRPYGVNYFYPTGVEEGGVLLTAASIIAALAPLISQILPKKDETDEFGDNPLADLPNTGNPAEGDTEGKDEDDDDTDEGKFSTNILLFIAGIVVLGTAVFLFMKPRKN